MPRHPQPDTADEDAKAVALEKVRIENDFVVLHGGHLDAAIERRALAYIEARAAGAKLREITEIVGCSDVAVINAMKRAEDKRGA